MNCDDFVKYWAEQDCDGPDEDTSIEELWDVTESQGRAADEGIAYFDV